MRKIKVTVCNHQADSYVHPMSDLVFASLAKVSMVVQDTECPY